MTENWVMNNHWDSDVTAQALKLLSTISAHYALFLIILIAYCALHTFNSLLLILGALLEKRLLLLPWMIQDLLTIGVIGLLFIFGAFLSFFIHVLIAIMFPIFAGLLLGFWLYMWRNIKELFFLYGIDQSEHLGTVYRKLPAGSGTRSILGP